MLKKRDTKHFHNQITGIFLIFLGLLNNKPLIERLFASDKYIESLTISIVIWSFTSVCVLIGAIKLFLDTGLNKFLNNMTLIIFSLTMIFYLTVFADRTVGHFTSSSRGGLIFPPNSEVIYESSEFKFTAKTNSLGFRDYEYPLSKNSKYRVLVLGDSFTFGWGVEIENTWIKLLEKNFLKRGYQVEILNLGRGGAFSTDYAYYAKKAVPLLRPDLVIVALLQGDDIKQASDSNVRKSMEKKSIRRVVSPKWGSNMEMIIQFLKDNIYPNSYNIIKTRPIKKTANERWRQEANDILSNLDSIKKARFKRIDREIKGLFLSGKFNPALIRVAIYDPDYFIVSNDTVNSSIREAVTTVANDLESISNICSGYGAKVIVLAIPYRAFVCKSDLSYLKKLGFNITEDLVNNNKTDFLIEKASKNAGLEFYGFSKTFNQACDLNNDIYFRLDGHFTEKGNKLFAESIQGIIEKVIAK